METEPKLALPRERSNATEGGSGRQVRSSGKWENVFDGRRRAVWIGLLRKDERRREGHVRRGRRRQCGEDEETESSVADGRVKKRLANHTLG